MRSFLKLTRLFFCLLLVSQHATFAANKTAGKATIYAKSFEGKKTADGEIYRRQKVSAASNKFPLGSKVLVKNKNNGRSEIVKINDRTAKRITAPVDLSNAAANKIGVKGTAPVEATLVSK